MGNRTFTEQEYLDLVTKLADQQYDQLEEDTDLENIFWDPSEPKIKEKIVASQNTGTLDLTKIKKDKIKELLFKHNHIKIYDFLIRITEYHGEPSKGGANLTVNITLYHERHKTELSGTPCKMTVPFSIDKDNRFQTRPWISYFVGPYGKEIPTDILIEIIRYMQVVSKLPAFL